MSNIVVGTKVIGDWGAMFPNSYGKVIAIRFGRSDNGPALATIEWDDDELGEETVQLDQIHQPGWTSANGSGIGIFVDDSFSDESYREYQKLVAQHNPPQ